MVLSVDEINRASTDHEKPRPWQQRSPTNPNIMKTKENKSKA